MMHSPDNNPEKLVSVSSDLEAAMIVSALAAHDVDATTSGEYTSGFRAEAPGLVKVLVRHCDVLRAREVLDQLTIQQSASHETQGASLAAEGSGLAWRFLLLMLFSLLLLGILQLMY